MVISFLGFMPAFSELSGNDRLTINISSAAYGMAALGGLLSFAALLVPAIHAKQFYRHKRSLFRQLAQKECGDNQQHNVQIEALEERLSGGAGRFLPVSGDTYS